MLDNAMVKNSVFLGCVQALKTGGQPVHGVRLHCAANRHLSAARTINVSSPVPNTNYFTRALTAITHLPATGFLPKITSVTAHLPTLSTPLITTTTIYIN